jgi:cytochrome c556
MARVWSAVLVAGVVGVLAGGAAADVISDRKDNRKAVGEQMKAIKAVVDASGPAAGVVAPAKKIVELEAPFEKMFPPGSDKGDTKALPAVWSDMKGFQDASHNLTEQATKMVELASANKSADEIKAQFGAMGKACGGCHNTYRAK